MSRTIPGSRKYIPLESTATSILWSVIMIKAQAYAQYVS